MYPRVSLATKYTSRIHFRIFPPFLHPYLYTVYKKTAEVLDKFTPMGKSMQLNANANVNSESFREKVQSTCLDVLNTCEEDWDAQLVVVVSLYHFLSSLHLGLRSVGVTVNPRFTLNNKGTIRLSNQHPLNSHFFLCIVKTQYKYGLDLWTL